MSLDERERTAEWGTGYRVGYQAGYLAGMADGQGFGYTDAKWRAHRAVAGRSRRTREAIAHYVGKMEPLEK